MLFRYWKTTGNTGCGCSSSPPKVMEKVVKQCRKLGIRKVWMQPDSGSERAIRYSKVNGMDILHDMCVMVQRTKQE